MGIEILFLILAVAVVAFGIGVIVVSRRNAASTSAPPARPARPVTPPPKPDRDRDVLVAEPPVEELPVEEVPVEEAPVEVEPEPVAPVSLRDRLAKARLAFTGAFAGVLGRTGITEESFDDLEEALLRADVGVGVAHDLLDGLRTKVAAKEITEPQQLLDHLEAEMVSRLAGSDRSLAFVADGEGPNVWMFVGVNGVGKTTTIGKLANQQVAEGRSVLLAAGDTFRAAAAEQLTTWAERSGVEIVRGAEGGDPSAVIYDGVERAAARGIDLVMADTAGRLHTKSNLMEELKKVRRVAEKGAGRVTETLLVIDATTGQNGMTQAREFREATDVTGVVLTKLDGSAKGGIVFAIETELGIPVKLVGIGETIGDLIPFDPAEFVSALTAP
ncbi:MAG TPA: signal recognition particle-docking protein FtsY [Ilumatobacteraceae bacterium]|nr:signal recognition particle-docking protein FtsY [Ilumatobacteraceae bacterium]